MCVFLGSAMNFFGPSVGGGDRPLPLAPPRGSAADGNMGKFSDFRPKVAFIPKTVRERATVTTDH